MENRPSAQALLEEISSDKRGKLKIFLGAAPGVGKTFAMLKAAHDLKSSGIDVVIGVVETHGRTGIQHLLHNLEHIPYKKLNYRGLEFEEFDIDVVLKRNPQLVLVDELAHTNIEGSRHVKRYQDVEELLNQGIDVYSTLNVQHLESLNDIVSRIIGATVRETVPDNVLGLASEIELIDLSPGELQKRLKEGKIYPKEKVAQALNNFFTDKNLTALREIALRSAAERVDEQMIEYLQAHGIEEQWHISEKLMVCIDDDVAATELIRHCSRTAERHKSDWYTFHVDTGLTNEVSRRSLTKSMQLAEELGGEAVTVGGNDVVAEIISFAKSHNITRVIIGYPPAKWWNILVPSVADQLLKEGNSFEVSAIPIVDIVKKEKRATNKPLQPQLKHIIKDYLLATFAVFLASVVVYFLRYNNLSLYNGSLLFLCASVYIATVSSLPAAIYTTILGFIMFHLYFAVGKIKPGFYFNYDTVITFIFFLVSTIITGHLSSKLKRQVSKLRQTNEHLTYLYEFSKTISAAHSLDSVVDAIVDNVKATFGAPAVIMLPEDGKLKIITKNVILDELSNAAARWAWSNKEAAGYASNTLAAASWFFVPMVTESANIGVIGINCGKLGYSLSLEQKRILNIFAQQAALAIDREQLVSDYENSESYTPVFSVALMKFKTRLAEMIMALEKFKRENKDQAELLDKAKQESIKLNLVIDEMITQESATANIKSAENNT